MKDNVQLDKEVQKAIEQVLVEKKIPHLSLGIFDTILRLPITEDREPKCSSLKRLVDGEIPEIRCNNTKENEYTVITAEVTGGLTDNPHTLLYIKTYDSRNNVFKREITYDTAIEKEWLYTYFNVMALVYLS